MPLLKSWVTSANTPECDFPLNNLPCGVFSVGAGEAHCGVAIGAMILDVTLAEEAGAIAPDHSPVFDVPFWNDFMELGPDAWGRFRADLAASLADGSPKKPVLEPFLTPIRDATLLMPFAVSEFTDYYSGRHHATNVGTMFRGAQNALPPNWLHMPIGYNGRASSVVVSGSDVRRPWGQIKPDADAPPIFAPSRKFDFELELGAIVGQPSDGMVSVQQADDMIFGYVLLNDWSARDIQAWEYAPLGPFQAKASATTISPWIVTRAALAPFRVASPTRDVPLLPHLHEPHPMLYDIALSATLAPANQAATTITRTNYAEMYFCAAQQLAHHTTSGCPMNVGDLLGSGTISGKTRPERGSLLELTWGGKDPITLDTDDRRTFLEDGDTLTLHAAAHGIGYRIGFGSASGQILPAARDPYAP